MKKEIFLSTILAAVLTSNVAQGQTPRIHWGKPVEAVLCDGANSTALDFSAVPSGKGILFTSNRADKENVFDETEKMYCTDLWYADRLDFGKYSMTSRLAGKVNTRSHEGVASLFPGGGVSRMVFSASNEETCDKTTGRARLHVKESMLADGAWKKPTDLPFNTPNAGSCHPTVSPDGRWVVFASDRTGSVGGMDLWASALQSDGSWSQPVNLGANVNTASNELFPFYGPDGQLYFSSNGHGGAGRLDIFVAAREAASADMGGWGKPMALAAPFNSDGDDFGFFLNNDLRSGWFSSNRGDSANDELWEWRAPARPTTVMAAGTVREKGGPGLPNRVVILRNKQTGEIIKRLTSDKDGNFDFGEIPCDADYEVVVNPDGPDTQRRDLSTRGACDLDVPKVERVLVELAPAKPTSVPGLVGTVKEKPSGKPLPGIKVILRNKKTGLIIQTLTTDAMGGFRVPQLDCDTEYEVVVDPDGLNPERRDISTKGKCEPGMKPIEVNTLIEIPLKDIVIRLDKLYYDYDKSYIRPDAAVELDKVVAFMKQYPSMVIELSSHTDSRGSDAYNLNLSQRRATEARQYILSKGIAPERISAVGRGETQLVNQCANGVKCTDPEHERNRRTEVRVLKFSETGVRIQN